MTLAFDPADAINDQDKVVRLIFCDFFEVGRPTLIRRFYTELARLVKACSLPPPWLRTNRKMCWETNRTQRKDNTTAAGQAGRALASKQETHTHTHHTFTLLHTFAQTFTHFSHALSVL